ncbi:MAG: helix-turn-helix domain-containing protein [Pleurocapsa sp. MO_192.B19]|nr:helix-turn-helix domain-containing protein [Pleurocapsa sp. MO_192.B19]
MDFFGLEKELDHLGFFATEAQTHLEQEITKIISQGRLIALSGIVGSGKTTFFQRLIADLGKAKEIIVSRSLAVESDRVSLSTLITALFYDLSTEKDFKVPTQPEKRERRLLELIKKCQRTVVLFVDDAHGLHHRTLVGLKRLIELVRHNGGKLSVVLAGHPKLKNDLRRPTLEEIGGRANVFALEGIRGHQGEYIQWVLSKATKNKLQPTDLLTEDAISFLGERELEALWQAEIELLSIYLPPTLLERTVLENSERDFSNIELIDRLAIRDPFLEQLAYAFKSELEVEHTSDRLYLESLQTMLCAHLLRHHCSTAIVTTEVSGGLPSSKLRQVIDYIQSNLERDLSLAQLAKVAHVSSHHFGKLFKQSMGVTPHQYVLKCRIERAKKLLSDKKLTLTEVSLATGFCHQSHFTNAFRRYTTLTPRQYRGRL